jgi:hypothetical protein
MIKPGSGGKLFYAAAILLLLAELCLQYKFGNAGDKNWRLLATHLWLNGRTLYHGTFVDVNPPLVIWFFSLPVRLAGWLGVVDYHMLVLFGLSFTAFSIFLSYRLITFHSGFAGKTLRRLFLLLLVFMFICYPTASWFFEREYIFLLCTFPYMLRFSPSLARAPLPPALRLAIGALAALGFCIKPHCTVLFAGIQLLYLLRERSFAILLSRENIIIYAAVLIYGIAVVTITPDYIHLILPMARATYHTIADFFDDIFYVVIALLTLAATLIDFRFRAVSVYRRDIYYLFALIPFLVAYVVLNNGWFVTFLPLMDYLLFLCALVGFEAFALKKEAVALGLPTRKYDYCMRACALVFALNAAQIGYAATSAFTGTCEDHIECRVDRTLIKEVRRPDGTVRTFGTMSSAFGRWLELNRATGAPLLTRFHHLWMLPKFEDLKAPLADPASWVLPYVAQAYAEDLTAREPDVIFVDAYDLVQADEGPPQMLNVFFAEHYPAFKDAWSHYRFDHTVEYCTSFRLGKPGCRFDAFMRVQ